MNKGENMRMKLNFKNQSIAFSTIFIFLIIPFLLISSPSLVFAQSNQQMTIGLESIAIFSLYNQYYTQLNSSYDSIVLNSMFSSLGHFHIAPYIFFNFGDLTLKVILNYWENDDYNLLPALASPEYLALSTNLNYSNKSFDIGIHQVIFFSKNLANITSGVTLSNATYELDDFYLIIKDLFSFLSITTGYSGSYYTNPLFRAVGTNSLKNSILIDPLSNNLYPLFLSVENSYVGIFKGWEFNGINAQNYIDILLTMKLFGIIFDLDFALTYSQNANNSSISFSDYFQNGLFRFHINYNNDSIGTFNLYFQPFIAKDNYYTTGIIVKTYYYEKGENLSSYFLSFDYSPKLSFLKDLSIVISFDGWFDKLQDQRTSSRTGSGTVTDPYIYSFVSANRFSIGFDGRYKLDALIKGFSIDALFLYFITPNNSYALTNAAGTTWADYISTLTSNNTNLVLSSYTEQNYMLYNFYPVANPYRLKAFLGVNYQFSNFITGIGFEYIYLYDDVANHLDFTNSATEFTGRTAPKTPYGYFDRIMLPLKFYYNVNSNLLIGINFNLFFYPNFPNATQLGYQDFAQTNSTVVSAEDQYNLDILNLPSYQINFIIQVIF